MISSAFEQSSDVEIPVEAINSTSVEGRRYVCLYQDSEVHYVSIQVAVLSIIKYEPRWNIQVYLTVNDTWLTKWLGNFSAVTVFFTGTAQNGFNAKPAIILDCLERTQGEVLWFDSDMLLTRPLSPLLELIPDDHCIVAENPSGDWPDGTEMRTKGWGFDVGRIFSETVNSCFVRFNQGHLDLARAWVAAIGRGDYVAAQSRHWSERPAYFLGDQDALNALLGSKRFEDIGISLIRHDRDIAQCFRANGYSWRSRLTNALSGVPPIIHAQGEKPWIIQDKIPIYLDISPYKLYARHYGPELRDQKWLEIKSKRGRLLHVLFRSSPILTGLIPAMIEDARRFGGRIIHPKRGRKLRGL